MKPKSTLLAVAAILGLGSGQIASATAQVSQSEQRQNIAVTDGKTAKEIRSDATGGYAGGLLRSLMRNTGNSPKDWGMSKACARMVRNNKMRRLGISGQRI